MSDSGGGCSSAADRAAEDSAYIDYHRGRFRYVVDLCRGLRPDRATRVLDIGRSRLTSMLADCYDSVTTLGLPYEVAEGFQGYRAPADGRCLHHVPFDLNQLRAGGGIPLDQAFDMIVFAEVIEHLYTAPELVLSALRQLLVPGGLIICQTPNAAGLHKRLILLAGRNPYEKIRVAYNDFGHFREYTRDELFAFAAAADLVVMSHSYENYFGVGSSSVLKRAADGIIRAASRIVPSFARGQTIVYRR